VGNQKKYFIAERHAIWSVGELRLTAGHSLVPEHHPRVLHKRSSVSIGLMTFAKELDDKYDPAHWLDGAQSHFSASRPATKVAFLVEHSTGVSGCLPPSMPIPSATTQHDSAKCTASIINATRSSPDRFRDNSSARWFQSSPQTFETADLLVAEQDSFTC
jgi:hypothetical protein